MRKALRKLDGKRISVTAKVERFGTKSGFNGPEPTILLKNVTDENGRVLTEHLWFTKGKSWADLNPGDTVRFSARVVQYVKGYQGHRFDVMQSREVDYRLVYPTKIQRADRGQEPPEMTAERKARFSAAAADLKAHRERIGAGAR